MWIIAWITPFIETGSGLSLDKPLCAILRYSNSAWTFSVACWSFRSDFFRYVWCFIILTFQEWCFSQFIRCFSTFLLTVQSLAGSRWIFFVFHILGWLNFKLCVMVGLMFEFLWCVCLSCETVELGEENGWMCFWDWNDLMLFRGFQVFHVCCFPVFFIVRFEFWSKTFKIKDTWKSQNMYPSAMVFL